MSNTLEEFQVKFRLSELTLHVADHWTWSLRPVPTTLGAGILSLNRFCTSFADLSSDEAISLGATVKHIDKRLAQVFAPDRMNYLMLMMVDRHLHFHVLPRYGSERPFGGLLWQDREWPAAPALGNNAELAQSPVLLEIRDALR